MSIKNLFVVSTVILSLIAGYIVWPDGVAGADLVVQATANPSSGPAPLLGVDVNISVSGTATGPITYKIDCTSDGIWERSLTLNSTTYSAPDLCDYTNPGSYSIKVFVERGVLSYETSLTVVAQESKTLMVEATATPSSGPAPLLGVDVNISVSGTATGPITYKIDCTSDGIWERSLTLNSSTYSAPDLCDYPNPGSYLIKVFVERGGLTYQTSLQITVFEQKTLFVELTGNPSSGTEPLNDVDLTAEVSGTAAGSITYKFDCTNDGIWERTITTSSNSYTAVDLCDYPNAGTYTAKVQVMRDNLTAEDFTQITVEEIKTLKLKITATPSSGHAPLTDVDLVAEVSGTTQGDITYKFDCRNDGSWEHIITTSNTSYTAENLCDYENEGTYTFRVSVSRDNLQIQGTGNIVVGETANLALEFFADPSFGKQILTGVDLISYVSGTATGPITYRFDCRNDGSWDKTVTTNDTSYTAVDLCSYYSPGVYTAKAKVERGGIVITGTAVISVSSQ